MRCRQRVSDNSAFVVKLAKRGGHLIHDIAFTKTLQEGDIVLHVNGDPECGRQVSGFKKNLLESLGFVADYDIAFLDFI
jgi:hypothetical protein